MMVRDQKSYFGSIAQKNRACLVTKRGGEGRLGKIVKKSWSVEGGYICYVTKKARSCMDEGKL